MFVNQQKTPLAGIVLERFFPTVEAQYSRHKHSGRLAGFKTTLEQDSPTLFSCLYDLFADKLNRSTC
jgi:hypothetical protein